MKRAINKLVSRWTSQQTREMQQALRGRRLKTRDQIFPAILRDGREYIDLRGLQLTGLISMHMEFVDLSYATMETGAILSKMVQNCIFDDARIWSTIGSCVCQCSLVHANMKGAHLRGQFVDCAFRESNLVSATAYDDPRFIRCDFRRAKMRKIHMPECLFDHCLWDGATLRDGSMAYAQFIGNHPTKKQLGNMLMSAVEWDATLNGGKGGLRELSREEWLRNQAAIRRSVARSSRASR